MKKFSYFKGEEVILSEEVLSEAVSKKNWHSEKAKFHREAAEFFKAGKMHDRAAFQTELAKEHEELSNV